MALGSFLTGALKGLSDYTYEERRAAREREDTMLKGQQQYLDHILKGVEAGTIDPRVYHQALTDAHSAAEALASPRKSKGGKAGFFGETELPILPFFESMKQPGKGAEMAALKPNPVIQQPSSGPFNPEQRPPQTIVTTPGGAEFGSLPQPPVMDAYPDGHPTNELIKHIDTIKSTPVAEIGPQQLQTLASSAPPTGVDIFKTPAQIASEKSAAETYAAIENAKQVATYLSSPEFKALSPEQQDAMQRKLTGYSAPAPQRLGAPKPIKDLNSPTGYSWVTTDPQSGAEVSRILGAPNQDKVTGPEARTKELAQMLMADDPSMTPEQALGNARRLLLKNTRMSAAMQIASLQGKQLDSELKQRIIDGRLSLPQAVSFVNTILPQEATTAERAQMIDALTSGPTGSSVTPTQGPLRTGGATPTVPTTTPPSGVSSLIPSGLGELAKHTDEKTRTDIVNINGFLNQIASTEAKGRAANWQGVGIVAGPLGAFEFKALGKGDPKAEALRISLGNLYGDLAKLRAGAALTKNEEKRLDSYAPQPNDSPERTQVKLAGLRDFWKDKLQALRQGVRTSTPIPKEVEDGLKGAPEGAGYELGGVLYIVKNGKPERAGG